MQAKAIHSCQQWDGWLFFQRRYALERQGLATRVTIAKNEQHFSRRDENQWFWKPDKNVRFWPVSETRSSGSQAPVSSANRTEAEIP